LTLLVKSLFFLVQLLPVRLLGAIGAGLGRFIYLIDRRHRNIALRNLNRIYPDRDDAWKIRIAHESFAELGRTMFEVPHVFMRSKAYLNSRIEVEGESLYRQAVAQGNGVILTARHHSNWELGALAISLRGHKSEMSYRSLRQPGINQFILNARSRFGTNLHSRSEGLRWLPRAMKNGHTIAVMIDQHLSNGTPLPFLGHMANTTTLPATVASKYSAPLIGVSLDRIGRSFRFKLRFWPIAITGQNGELETEESQIMQMVCASFEPLIHQRPELWLWIHRRWLYLDERELQAS